MVALAGAARPVARLWVGGTQSTRVAQAGGIEADSGPWGAMALTRRRVVGCQPRVAIKWPHQCAINGLL